MVPDNRQRDTVEKPTQGSLLAVMNLALKLFGYFQDSMIGSEKLLTPQGCEKVAFVGKPRKMSAGCLTLKSMESMTKQRHVLVQVISHCFDTVFLDNKDLSNTALQNCILLFRNS
jgi:hypothetical protein